MLVKTIPINVFEKLGAFNFAQTDSVLRTFFENLLEKLYTGRSKISRPLNIDCHNIRERLLDILPFKRIKTAYQFAQKHAPTPHVTSIWIAAIWILQATSLSSLSPCLSLFNLGEYFGGSIPRSATFSVRSISRLAWLLNNFWESKIYKFYCSRSMFNHNVFRFQIAI